MHHAGRLPDACACSPVQVPVNGPVTLSSFYLRTREIHHRCAGCAARKARCVAAPAVKTPSPLLQWYTPATRHYVLPMFQYSRSYPIHVWAIIFPAEVVDDTIPNTKNPKKIKYPPLFFPPPPPNRHTLYFCLLPFFSSPSYLNFFLKNADAAW